MDGAFVGARRKIIPSKPKARSASPWLDGIDVNLGEANGDFRVNLVLSCLAPPVYMLVRYHYLEITSIISWLIPDDVLGFLYLPAKGLDSPGYTCVPDLIRFYL